MLMFRDATPSESTTVLEITQAGAAISGEVARGHTEPRTCSLTGAVSGDSFDLETTSCAETRNVIPCINHQGFLTGEVRQMQLNRIEYAGRITGTRLTGSGRVVWDIYDDETGTFLGEIVSLEDLDVRKDLGQ